MEAGMTVAEFNHWLLYNSERLLPHRRFEYYAAQLTLHVSHLAAVMGSGARYTIHDFLFDKREAPKQDTSETGMQVIGAMAGGVTVVKLGQGRKKKAA